MKRIDNILLLTIAGLFLGSKSWAEGSISSSASETRYNSLADAVASVAENNAEAVTLTLNGDIEISSRVNISNRNIIIKGATGSERILRKTTFTNSSYYLSANGDHLTVTAITSPIWNKTTLTGYNDLPTAVSEAT